MRHLVKCLAAVVLLTTPGSVWGNGPDARAAFERLKQLAGAWLATAGDGKGAATSFEIIGGGSTVVEKYRDPRMGPGNEMVTMYHLDGARLLLTHYCMAKNQPRMQLTFFDPAIVSFDSSSWTPRTLRRPARVTCTAHGIRWRTRTASRRCGTSSRMARWRTARRSTSPAPAENRGTRLQPRLE